MPDGLTDLTTLHLRRRRLDRAAYAGRAAQDSDYRLLVTEPTRILNAETGELVVVYVPLPDDVETGELVSALRRLPFPWFRRTKGLESRSHTFGSSPRIALHNPWCRQADMATYHPDTHALLVWMAPVVARLYEQHNPVLATRHSTLSRKVLPDWHLEGTFFTSGIANRDSTMAYHTDTGNFPGVWSAMLAFTRDVHGGHLVLPAYDVALEVADRTVSLFDGQSLLHGVTRVVRTEPLGSYRFTVVYYSLEQMCHCDTPDIEQERKRSVLRRRRHARQQQEK